MATVTTTTTTASLSPSSTSAPTKSISITTTSTKPAPTYAPAPVSRFNLFGGTTRLLLDDHYTSIGQHKFTATAQSKGTMPYRLTYGTIATPLAAPTQATSSSSSSSSSPSYGLNGFLNGSLTFLQCGYSYTGYTDPTEGDTVTAFYQRPFDIDGLSVSAGTNSIDRNLNYNKYSANVGVNFSRDRVHLGSIFTTDLTTHHMETTGSVKIQEGLSVGANMTMKAITPGLLVDDKPNSKLPITTTFSVPVYNVGLEHIYQDLITSVYTSPSSTCVDSSAPPVLTNFNTINFGMSKVVNEKHTLSVLGAAEVTGAQSAPARSLTVGSSYKLSPFSLVKAKMELPTGRMCVAFENRFASPLLTFNFALQGRPATNTLEAWGTSMAFGDY